MTTFHWILIYCVLIVAGSYLGGWLPSLVRLSHTAMQVIISFVGGLMLGVSLFHLLPHGVILAQSLDRGVWWLVAGLLTMFFLIRVFHFHQHATSEDDAHNHATGDTSDPHAHHHGQTGATRPAAHRLSWVGVAIGLAIHSLIDGIALGAAVMAEAHDETALPGFSIFLVIALHKPLDALSITSLMAAGGWSSRVRQVVNVGFATMCPLGAALLAIGVGEHQDAVVGCALAFSAGVFLCISLGDLLPELHFHTHDRLKLSAALLLGIATSYVVGYLEPHPHEFPGQAASHQQGHDEHNHDHSDH
jgi:zinc and cadmium transporter